MKAYRIYTTVFVVNKDQRLVVAVECRNTEDAISTADRLNKEFKTD